MTPRNSPPPPPVPWWREIYVDRKDATPPFQQIAGAVRHKIATNQIASRAPLPSVRALARAVGVTPATVARAYQILQEEGLVVASAGVGTAVAPLDDLGDRARASSREGLDAALDAAVRALRSQGYNTPDIHAALSRKLEELASSRSVVFVGGSAPVVRKYEAILRQHLGDLGIEVHGLVQEQLEPPSAETGARLAGAELAVTLLSFQRTVQRLVAPFELPVEVILVEVTLETLQRLADLPPDATVLFVAEEHYRSVGVGMVRAYCDDERLLVARDLAPAALARDAARASLVIHTLGTADIVEEVMHDRPALELGFRTREDSLSRLRSVLSQPTAA